MKSRRVLNEFLLLPTMAVLIGNMELYVFEVLVMRNDAATNEVDDRDDISECRKRWWLNVVRIEKMKRLTVMGMTAGDCSSSL